MFEEVKKEFLVHPEVETIIPTHATRNSAGADIHIKEDITLAPFGKAITYTDLRCEMSCDEVLLIFPRSSVGIKQGLMLSNTIPVIDSDYYDNTGNGGNIALALFNTSPLPIELKAGDRIAQGVVTYFRQCGKVKPVEREGGLGHSGR